MTNRTSPQPVLDEDALYFGDNGRVFCGRCAGASARYTGRDISGQPVMEISTEVAQEFEEAVSDIRGHCECETCGKRHRDLGGA
ncbi:MAG: hypothetical protein GF328_13405 [Candidatus Latescibacteria bacterium]|nr:hypothetical protein [Candidatus Latescibacterota bacterium]